MVKCEGSNDPHPLDVKCFHSRNVEQREWPSHDLIGLMIIRKVQTPKFRDGKESIEVVKLLK